MPATSNCNPCCSEPLNTNVPGVQGDPGTDGTDGQNAYTITTTETEIPAIGDPVTVDVENSDWMAIGQVVVLDGPAHFTVTSKPSSITVELTFLGYTGDISPTDTVASGATLVGTGVEQAVSLDYTQETASGTAYTLTAAPALLNFGTTDPTITLTSVAGDKFLISARAQYEYAAWESTAKTISSILRRTNNTPGDIAETQFDFVMTGSTVGGAVTGTALVAVLPTIVYTAIGTNDIIQFWGSLSGLASVGGNVTATEANIAAVKIA